MKTEFHVHTNASKDSLFGRYALLAMCRLRGINCLAITDHNEVRGAAAIQTFMRSHGVDVIIGEEIFTKDGEIIGLFLTERIPAGLSAQETVKRIKDQNGIVYIPHPYDLKRNKTVIKPVALERIADQVDCIEVHNGRNSDVAYSEMQRSICEKYGRLPVVGGDAHCFFEVGRNFCVTNVPFNRAEFNHILSGADFHVSRCIQLAHRATKFVKAVKMLQRGDYDGLRRAFNRRSR